MKLCQGYLFPLWLLLGICSGQICTVQLLVIITFLHITWPAPGKFYVLYFYSLLLGSVINRKARNSEDDLDKRGGLRKQLDDLTEEVKKIQEEIENDGKFLFSKLFIYGRAMYTCCLKCYWNYCVFCVGWPFSSEKNVF